MSMDCPGVCVLPSWRRTLAVPASRNWWPKSLPQRGVPPRVEVEKGPQRKAPILARLQQPTRRPAPAPLPPVIKTRSLKSSIDFSETSDKLPGMGASFGPQRVLDLQTPLETLPWLPARDTWKHTH